MPRGATPTGKATVDLAVWLYRYIVVPAPSQTLFDASMKPPAEDVPASWLTQTRGAPGAESEERFPPVCALAIHTLSRASMLMSVGELRKPPVAPQVLL